MHPHDCRCVKCLVDRSSFGTPDAKAARESVSDEQAARVVARAKELDVEAVLAETGVTANTWHSAARRLADENRRLRDALTAAERKADINYRLADERSAWKGGYEAMRAHAEEWERNGRNWQRRAEAAEAKVARCEALTDEWDERKRPGMVGIAKALRAALSAPQSVDAPEGHGDADEAGEGR